jgi:4-hydroxy-tetrahydrodipicolinate reductase
VLDLVLGPATTVLAMGATRVAVIGASGRMGGTVCAAVDAAGDLELVGRFDMGDDLDDLAGAQVVVEFSVPDASPANVAHCVARGVHVVVGTTGWSDERLETLRHLMSGCSSPRTSPSGRCS